VILYDKRANALDAMRATTGATTLASHVTTSFVATSVSSGLVPASVLVRALAYR
jgi:hypothetical protein